MSERKKRLIVIGGGFGGISFVKSLKNENVEIILIDKNNYHLFQPLLYQVAGTVLSPSDIAVPLRWIFRKQKNVKVSLDEVLSIDSENNKIKCKNVTWDDDYLILASGLVNNYFGNNDWGKYTTTLKNLDDALSIRNQVLKKFEDAEWIKKQSDLEKKNEICNYWCRCNWC